MKVKIFTSIISNDDLENQISEWTSGLNPEIHKIEVNAICLHDRYGSDYILNPEGLCNQWTERTASIIYDIN